MAGKQIEILKNSEEKTTLVLECNMDVAMETPRSANLEI